MLSLAIVSFSRCSSAISSSTGATILHGPHHSAQKSTRTGLSLPSTSLAKVASVTVTVLPAMVALLVDGRGLGAPGGGHPRGGRRAAGVVRPRGGLRVPGGRGGPAPLQGPAASSRSGGSGVLRHRSSKV